MRVRFGMLFFLAALFLASCGEDRCPQGRNSQDPACWNTGGNYNPNNPYGGGYNPYNPYGGGQQPPYGGGGYGYPTNPYNYGGQPCMPGTPYCNPVYR